MFRKIVALVLGINGILMLLISGAMIARISSRISQLGLEASAAESLATPLNSLAASDAGMSLFSFVAMYLVYKGSEVGKILGLLVSVNLVIVGIGIFALTNALFGLYFIAARGLLVGILLFFLEPTKA